MSKTCDLCGNTVNHLIETEQGRLCDECYHAAVVLQLPPVTKVRENFDRRWAARLGLRLAKSRGKKPRINDLQGWRILQGDWVIAGERFDLSLDEVERLLAEREQELKAGG